MSDSFTRFSAAVSHWAGRPEASALAAAGVALWAVTGPIFGFSENWQLVINTTTTIITFLMVFVIQSSQNRDTAALHVKLDELIRATKEARNTMLAVDELSEDELRRLRQRYAELAKEREPAPPIEPARGD